jgi:hypothetical protein
MKLSALSIRDVLMSVMDVLPVNLPVKRSKPIQSKYLMGVFSSILTFKTNPRFSAQSLLKYTHEKT